MRKILFFNFLLLFLAFSYTTVAQIFVKQYAKGGDNGSSWANAYSDLQSALDAASAGDEIWVATGKYKPDDANGNTTATFEINADIILLGGFNGSETEASERNPTVNLTILSGDLNGDDIDDDFDNFKSDNVQTIIKAATNVTEATVIDGFVIQGGYADGTTGSANSTNSGGGLYTTGIRKLRRLTLVLKTVISKRTPH